MVLFNDRNHFHELDIKSAHWSCSGWSSRRAPWTAALPLHWWRADQLPSRASPRSAMFQRGSSLTRRRQHSRVRVIALSHHWHQVPTLPLQIEQDLASPTTRMSLWPPPGMRLPMKMYIAKTSCFSAPQHICSIRELHRLRIPEVGKTRK